MRYTIKVKPGTSQEKIVQESEDVLVVYLHARPHDGEANKSLIAVLAKHFGVPKSSVKIVLGQKSRTKIVEI